MSNPLIEIENLTKFFGSFRAVSSVSFNVNEGEIFGFLGPNGAGKTSCIKMMLDLLRPDKGTIRIFGQEVRENSVQIRNLIGFLPGNFTSFDNMTGIEFLKFACYQRKKSFKYPDHLCARFELGFNDLNKKMKAMSHGMLQKVGIIQVLQHEPKFLILDEPTSGLDPIMQEVFYNVIKEQNQNGVTVLFSSHNLHEVQAVCNNIAIIREGKIVALEHLENLRKKVCRKLKVKMKVNPGGRFFEGAELISQQGLTYEFLIKENTENVIKELSQLPVADFSFPEPGLNEVFMSYYESNVEHN